VQAIHADQVREHGGSLGLRDLALLESALERAPTRWRYRPRTKLTRLAASYGIGLAKNHPFVDGNKRVAFQAMYVFLGLNGVRVVATEPEVVRVMLDLAAGTLDEEAVTRWLDSHTAPR
jgi:death-on-curing protein